MPAGCTAWSEAEKQIVRDLFPDTNAIHRLLPKRTKCAIRNKWRALGLRTPMKQVPWNHEELKALKETWGTPLHACIHDRLSRHKRLAIDKMASKLGLTKLRSRRRSVFPTGHAVMDGLRKRAREDGVTMEALDIELGTASYFRSFGHVRRPDWDRIVLAVEFFGGRLVIDWQDE